jgi:ketosteroid isomerase-like protein
VTEHQNAETFKRGYAAFGQGDMDTLKEVFAPELVWHAPGNNSVSGDYKGIDDVLGFFGRIFQETNGTLKIDVHDILANDTHGVAITTFTGQRNGKSMDMRGVHVVHFNGDGKLTESWQFPEDTAEADRFWA